MEALAVQTRSDLVGVGGVSAIGVEAWGQGGAESEPEAAKGAEDDKRKGVAEEELEDAAKAHEEATDEVVSTYGSDAGLAGPTPAHQLT